MLYDLCCLSFNKIATSCLYCVCILVINPAFMSSVLRSRAHTTNEKTLFKDGLAFFLRILRNSDRVIIPSYPFDAPPFQTLVSALSSASSTLIELGNILQAWFTLTRISTNALLPSCASSDVRFWNNKQFIVCSSIDLYLPRFRLRGSSFGRFWIGSHILCSALLYQMHQRSLKRQWRLFFQQLPSISFLICSATSSSFPILILVILKISTGLFLTTLVSSADVY